MSVIVVLIIASVLIAGGFLIAFIWSVKKGQYEDDITPGIRMLFDDEAYIEKSHSTNKPKK
jgi:cbb3-type cytochrome oxidase maturation protein